jgi:hypothetical protein
VNALPPADRLLGPEPPAHGCDECFEYLDRYVEAELGHEFAPCPACVGPVDCSRARHCLGMRAHLAGCPACAEEHDSLLALVRRES